MSSGRLVVVPVVVEPKQCDSSSIYAILQVKRNLVVLRLLLYLQIEGELTTSVTPSTPPTPPPPPLYHITVAWFRKAEIMSLY